MSLGGVHLPTTFSGKGTTAGAPVLLDLGILESDVTSSVGRCLWVLMISAQVLQSERLANGVHSKDFEPRRLHF